MRGRHGVGLLVALGFGLGAVPGAARPTSTTTSTVSSTSTTYTTMHMIRRLNAARDAWAAQHPGQEPNEAAMRDIGKAARKTDDRAVHQAERKRDQHLEQMREIKRRELLR